MPTPIRASIERRLLDGQEPGVAYAGAVAEALSDARPERLEEALDDWGIRRPPRPERPMADLSVSPEMVVRWVVGGGGVDDVPSAECVRQQLSGIDHPTRDDIERAFDACRGA